MLSINTNLSSIIAQRSMKQSTNKLNQAIERMTTGAKINHAKDNAANYNIATNMTTQLGSYEVAADNVAMGMDLVTAASDTVYLMQDKGERLRELAIQVRNGTFGEQALMAVNAEAQSIISEIYRLYITSEYNGIKLFDMANTAVANQASEPLMTYSMQRATPTKPEAKAEYNGFVENPVNYTQTQINNMDSIDSFTSGVSGEFKIENPEDLVKLGNLESQDTSNAIFVLANDIDLTDWQNTNDAWGGICLFNGGTIDGNGHVIKNLKGESGLFAETRDCIIKNLGLINVDITCDYQGVGGLVSYLDGGKINNCYVTGKISSTSVTGGLVCSTSCEDIEIENCYSTAKVTGGQSSGGLIGAVGNGNGIGNMFISNCYTTSIVSGYMYIGGLVGIASADNIDISNCYATGNVTGDTIIGGLLGAAQSNSTNIIDSFTTGQVEASLYAGGLVAMGENANISNCYAIGNVNAMQMAGGLVGGGLDTTITSSYASGNISAQIGAGGLVAIAQDSNISNSYAIGNVNATQMAGGLVSVLGAMNSACSISDSYAYGSVTGTDSVGSLVGAILYLGDDINTIANYSIMNCQTVLQAYDPIGGFIDGSMAPIVGDVTPFLAGITILAEHPTTGSSAGSVNLQVGINSNLTSMITLNTSFSIDLTVLDAGIEAGGALVAIDNFLNILSEKATHYGAVQNRLESALEEITIRRENLISSRSTLQDADIAEISSEYIRQQILQQASATLLSTANQSASIALSLI